MATITISSDLIEILRYCKVQMSDTLYVNSKVLMKLDKGHYYKIYIYIWIKTRANPRVREANVKRVYWTLNKWMNKAKDWANV